MGMKISNEAPPQYKNSIPTTLQIESDDGQLVEMFVLSSVFL